MITTNTIAEVRESHTKLSKEVNGRTAVIVLSNYTARKQQYGVQYWTPEMIAVGQSKNTDNTKSIYISNL